MHPGMNAQHDSKIQKVSTQAKNPFFREHLLKIILRGFLFVFCFVGCWVFFLKKKTTNFFGYCYSLHDSQNKLYNKKCFIPQGKMTATETFISISSQTTNKGAILQISSYPVKWKQSSSSTASLTSSTAWIF